MPLIGARKIWDFRLRWALILLLLFTAAAPGLADVRPPSLSRLLGNSDLVIYAKVAEVGENAFRVHIITVLAGTAPSGLIDVLMPKRWPDEPRWAPYEVGQTLVLFLGRDSKRDNRWGLVGPFGRGEFPADAGFAFFPEYYKSLGEQRNYRVFGVDALFQQIEIRLFFSALREYSECFSWQGGVEPGMRKPALICAEAPLAEYESQSPFHRYLASETLRILSQNLTNSK